MELSRETVRAYADQAEKARLEPKMYRNQDAELAVAVRLDAYNFSNVASWLKGMSPSDWTNGPDHIIVGQRYGEYDEQVWLPFGWWIVQHGAEVVFLAPEVFENEYVAD